MDGQESLLPDAVLAKLRQKGVTVWEFYYDTSAETYGEGDFGEEVRALQGYLLATGLFQSEHGATGFFGPATQAALIEWQRQHGVEPALGVWGPFSRDKYRQLVAEDASRRGLLHQGAEKPSVRAADRPGPSRWKAEASPPASSASISVPVKAPAASHAAGGLSLAHSLVAAFVVLGGAIVAGVFLRQKKVPSRASMDAQELDRTKNMLELDRTGGPQPRSEQAGRQNGDLEKR